MTTNAPRETLGVGLDPSGTHDSLELPDTLHQAGELCRDTGNLGLQVTQPLSRFAGRLLAGSSVTDIGTAPRPAFNQTIVPELRVGVLDGHQRYAKLLGVGPTTRKAVPRTERPCGDLTSDPGGDFAGVGLSLRL